MLRRFGGFLFKGGILMNYFKKIVGERVYLSPITLEDTNIYVKWLNDLEITDRINQSYKVCNEMSEKAWIEKTLSNELSNFAIVNLEDDTLIGNCGINAVDHISRTATIGIFIGDKENRGKGYGTEALKLLIGFGFNYLNLRNIDLRVFDFNKNAIACYKKVGFKEYGRRHSAYFCNGKYHDVIYMEILSDDFKNGDE